MGRSIRYLLEQLDRLEVEPEDEEPPPVGPPDIQLLLDYWDMAAALGWDLSSNRVRFPFDLMEAHDAAGAQLERQQEAARPALFRIRRRLLSRWSYASGPFFIRPAGSQRELTDEGNALHHCVSTYGPDHAEGKTAIFFIRRRARPREPFYTLELDERKLTVRQDRGAYNCVRTPEVTAFESEWLSWVRAGAPRDRAGRPVEVRGGSDAAEPRPA